MFTSPRGDLVRILRFTRTRCAFTVISVPVLTGAI
jgi:hypothetical protein